jgi:peptidoglycan-associated lipoprotein
MKASRLTYLMVIGLALTFAATGCRKKPTGVTDLPGYRAGAVGGGDAVPPPGGTFNPATDPNAIGGGPLNPDLQNLDNFNQDRTALAQQTVLFDFDSSAVKSSEQSKVDAVAANLQNAPANVALLVEGHCDERGTEEYNRSLGERRALALREALASQGVSPMRVTTRSFGEDRPAVPGNNESAYRQNRRGEFVVLTPK